MPLDMEDLRRCVRMSEYRDAMSRAARMTRIARRGNFSLTDRAFLGTEAMELYKAAQRYKEEILLFDSYRSSPW